MRGRELIQNMKSYKIKIRKDSGETILKMIIKIKHSMSALKIGSSRWKNSVITPSQDLSTNTTPR